MTDTPQVDIFGQNVEPEPELPDYMTRTLAATPVRLFEPQMEGQLALEDSE